MKREVWLDYLRAFACVLVAVGHLLKSFEEAGIIGNFVFTSFFVKMIYHFHVHIFFFCSGYLFQKKYVKLNGLNSFVKTKLIHCLDLFIPYVIFSAATYLIKEVVSSGVNSTIHTSFTEVIFADPINQMWYLYTLALIIVIMPAIKSKGMLFVSLVGIIIAKCIIYIPGVEFAVPIKYLFGNSIWFFMGMLFEYKQVKINNIVSILCSIVFVSLSVYDYINNITNPGFRFLTTLLGVLASVGIMYWCTHKKENMSFVWRMLSKYMFQIYLLHTIFAAAIRIVLLKVGCSNLIIQTVFGIVFSFVVPIICAMIAEKNVLNFVFFPSKTIHVIRGKHNKNLGVV